MPTDPTYNAANQQLQGGADWEVGGKLNIDTVAGGKFQVDDVDETPHLKKLLAQPATATFAPAAGGANVCLLTITLKDANGVAIAAPTAFDLWLSDAATGIGLTATAASGAVAAGASGFDLGALTAKKALRCVTNAAGVYILSITDSGKTGFYPAVGLGGIGGKTVAGAQLVTGNYG